MTTKGFLRLGTALMLALVATGPALARDGGPMRPDFSQIDADGDGLITAAELDSHGAARFAALDADGDGALSADELAAMTQRIQADSAVRMIARFDADGDRKLSQAEMPGPDRTRMMARMDINEDGVLDAGEFASAGRHGGPRGHGGADGARHGDRMPSK
ncbi:EF-hand domain-containing protein [Meridianimarinicoccus roseus]|nr:EF-hand domain-containing protein [Meridianimarinicoccus roseus]